MQQQEQRCIDLSRDVLPAELDGGVPHGVRADGARVRLVFPGGSEQPFPCECCDQQAAEKCKWIAMFVFVLLLFFIVFPSSLIPGRCAVCTKISMIVKV